MKRSDLLLLIEEGEGLTVEFKEKYTSKIVQDIVAFANSRGGRILLGVSDDGKIKGEKLTGQLKAEIFSLGRNCDPKVEVSVKQLDRKEVRGDLLTQFNETEFFLKRHMSLQGIIEGMKRRNVYEVPLEAWREAIANAIIHRDYRFGGTSIQVRVFPDRVEVISPGRLPKGVTPKNIGDMSSRRNEVIADMFARLDVIEKAGTGIIRIREAMEAENLKPPEFEDKGEFFKIILYRPKGVSPEGGVPRNVPRNGPRNVTTNDSEELSKTQLAILELFKKEPTITISEIAIILNLADRTIKRAIDFLKKSGLIERIGSTKSGHWEVTYRSRK